MNNAYNEVKKFHEAFGHPVSSYPIAMGQQRVEVRAKWMQEEIQEFLDAARSQPHDKVVVEQADAMIDLIYFGLGTLVEMGVEPERLFAIVQAANMAKLHADGKPRYKPDGKILKPDGWVAPDVAIELEIENQLKRNVPQEKDYITC